MHPRRRVALLEQPLGEVVHDPRIVVEDQYPFFSRRLLHATSPCSLSSHSGRRRGRSTVKRLPRPGVDAAETLPPRCRTIALTTARPSPVPPWAGLVVKNGSDSVSRASSDIPPP